MRKKAISEFKDYIFWGKNPYDTHHNFSFSIYDKCAIEHSVLKAYPDMQLRTLGGLGNVKGVLKRSAKEEIVSTLAEKIFDYLHNDSIVNFDRWHSSVCKDIANIFGKHTGFVLAFGKTQKLVNMSFKYVYCLDDACRIIHKFYDCHMALDSVILTWFKKQTFGGVSANNWSSMTECEYKQIQTSIRSYCKSKNTYPLLEEFEIWLREKA